MKLILGLLTLFALPVAGVAADYDLLVYGGTAGGVITSVAAARQGLKVILVEPRTHIGGMATGGLSRTDFGKQEVIGGYALEFYWRVGLKYEIGRYAQQVAWYYEPKVGEAVLREMLTENHIDVAMGQALREKDGVRKQGTQIVSATLTNGRTIAARAFADCSYEGDLMAQAGVSYTFGREASTQYGESLAGVRDRTPLHQFRVKIPARDADGKLLPEIWDGKNGPAGSADKHVQAYNFRMILSDDPANRVPFAKPTGYDAKRYELFARLLDEMTRFLGRPPVLQEVTLIAPIPNHKADINNQGAFSTDYLTGSWEYPDASYARRAQIWQAHVDYTAGYFYFLSHDPRVPQSLQDEMNRWGLAKDEFTDLQNWPHQLYIREARRMVGDFVMTQKDLQTELTKPDAIGMGSYNSDSHNVVRLVNAEGFVENEGDMQVAVKPYQIPYRVMVPKAGEAANLLVPVCFSASHVAYSSLRMEPQYMIMGQAAGLAIAMALKKGTPVQQVDTAELHKILMEQGAVMEYKPAAITAAFFQNLWKRYPPTGSDRQQSPF
jgi:hypothetical protein